MIVPSPCRKSCTLDEARTQCLVCRRTLAEIAGWSTMTDAEKRAVLARIDALPPTS